MAQRVITELIDDLDGREAVETVRFAVDGVSYEIDLAADNAAKLRDDFAAWSGNARRTSHGRRRTSPGTGRSDTAQIRQWAQENGLKVSDRGRISAEVQEAYDKARKS